MNHQMNKLWIAALFSPHATSSVGDIKNICNMISANLISWSEEETLFICAWADRCLAHHSSAINYILFMMIGIETIFNAHHFPININRGKCDDHEMNLKKEKKRNERRVAAAVANAQLHMMMMYLSRCARQRNLVFTAWLLNVCNHFLSVASDLHRRGDAQCSPKRAKTYERNSETIPLLSFFSLSILIW